jgi:hypothetical protein
VVKTLWGFAKVRYRGLLKNTARAFAAFALANLYLARRTLLEPRYGLVHQLAGSLELRLRQVLALLEYRAYPFIVDAVCPARAEKISVRGGEPERRHPRHREVLWR